MNSYSGCMGLILLRYYWNIQFAVSDHYNNYYKLCTAVFSFPHVGVVSLARQCANVIAREGRGFLSTNKLPPYSQAYILLDRAIQTLTNFKPIVM